MIAAPVQSTDRETGQKESRKAGPDDDGVVKRRDKDRQPDLERTDHQYLAECRQQRHRGKDKEQVRGSIGVQTNGIAQVRRKVAVSEV